ncbi:hypothetical protein GQ42DRAFT_161238 [Ramicandelaber brevisporus]|nr:hypothetical protein GQ42DRAFT_161238 [Ramicandelaber brevisporus]
MTVPQQHYEMIDSKPAKSVSTPPVQSIDDDGEDSRLTQEGQTIDESEVTSPTSAQENVASKGQEDAGLARLKKIREEAQEVISLFLEKNSSFECFKKEIQQDGGVHPCLIQAQLYNSLKTSTAPQLLSEPPIPIILALTVYGNRLVREMLLQQKLEPSQSGQVYSVSMPITFTLTYPLPLAPIDSTDQAESVQPSTTPDSKEPNGSN